MPRRSPLGEGGPQSDMVYTYILASESPPKHYYVGSTSDLKTRLTDLRAAARLDLRQSARHRRRGSAVTFTAQQAKDLMAFVEAQCPAAVPLFALCLLSAPPGLKNNPAAALSAKLTTKAGRLPWGTTLLRQCGPHAPLARARFPRGSQSPSTSPRPNRRYNNAQSQRENPARPASVTGCALHPFNACTCSGPGNPKQRC